MTQTLYDLATEYHERCEAYDRTVCTGQLTTQERILINWNAVRVFAELRNRSGCTYDELQSAIRYYRPEVTKC